MATRIVSLQAKLGLDGTGFQQGIRRAGHLMDEFGYSAKTLQHTIAGAFSFYAVEQFAHHVLTAVSRFRNLAEQMNISTDEVQQFDAAAITSGQTIEDLQAPLGKLAAARRDAAEGNEELRGTFQRLGVSLQDLNNPALRNIDLLKMIAEATQKVGFSAKDAADFRDLFGRSGERLAAIFRDLQDVHIQPITPDDIQRIHEAEHALKMFEVRLTAIAATIPNLRLEDFIGRLASNMLGVKTSKTDEPGMSKEDVAAANARRHFQEQQAFEAGNLFKEKTKKEKEVIDYIYPHRTEAKRPDNFLAGMNARFGSISSERGFALLTGKREDAKIELNTRQTVEVLRQLLPFFRLITGTTKDELSF